MVYAAVSDNEIFFGPSEKAFCLIKPILLAKFQTTCLENVKMLAIQTWYPIAVHDIQDAI